MSYSFRSYHGGQWYDLPDKVTLSMGFEFSEISGCTIAYPTNGVNAAHVVEDATIVAYYNGVEIKNGRWWLLGASGQSIEDGVKTTTYPGKSLFNIFSKAVVHTPAGKDQIDFNDSSVGGVLINLFNAVQARGGMQGITWDFSATQDSKGNAWVGTAASFDISFKTGDDYGKIVQGLVDRGLIELEFEGTVLHGYNVDGLGTDRSGTIELVAGRDYEEAPFKRTIENRAHYALVIGDEGKTNTYTSTLAVGPYGREEVAISQGGTKDVNLLYLVAQNAVKEIEKAKQEFTRKVNLEACPFLPGVDFVVGDWISERVGSDSLKYRVRSMAISADQNGTHSVSLVLNDRILEAEIRRERRLAGLISGASGAGSAGGSPTSAPDATTPAAPTGLAVVSDAYVNDVGVTRALAQVDWSVPTLNTDGSQLTDLAGYELQYRKGTAGSYNWNRWKAIKSTDNYELITDLDVNAPYDFRVRAFDNASTPHYSAFSSILSWTMAVDTIPPPNPSPLTLYSKLGTITATWDGKGSANEDMPKDFRELIVYASKTPGFTASSATEVNRIPSAGGSCILTKLAGGETWYFKSRTVDRSGNQSALSTEVSIVVNRISGPDLQANSVTTNELAVGSVEAENIALGTFNKNLVPDPSFEEDYDILPKASAEYHQWRIDATLNTGGVPAAARVTKPRSGLKGLQLTCMPNSWIRVLSGNIDVVPGKTYVVSVNAARLESAQVARAYIRVAAGSTDALAEYPASNLGNTLVFDGDDGSTFAESKDVNYSGNPPSPSDFSNFTGEVTIPAGINKIAVLIWNYMPSGTSNIIFDDISVVEKGQGATELTSAGLRLFGRDGTEVAAFVANRPNYFSVTKDGDTVASISDEGKGSFTDLSVDNDPEIGGTPLLGGFGSFDSPTEQQDANPGLLDKLPRGVIAHGSLGGGNAYTTRRGIYELAFEAQPGRSYLVQLGAIHTTIGSANTVTGFGVGLVNPTSVGGVAATPNFSNMSTILFSQDEVGTAGRTVTLPTTSKVLRCNPSGPSVGGELMPGTCKLFLYVTGDLATVTPSSADNLILDVIDMGPDIPITSLPNNSTLATPQATQTSTKTYTKTYASTSAATYKGSGGKRTDTTDVVQGYNSYNGDGEGLWIFPSMTADIGSATVKKIEVYCYASHWYYNSGGTALIKVHGYTAAPATNPTMTNALNSAKWPNPGGRWVTLPSSLYAGFKSGTYRGFGLGPAGSSSMLYYGRFKGGTSARIRVTYVK